jgi:Rrf2 family protein
MEEYLSAQDPDPDEAPILSQTAEYALRAVVHLAQHEGAPLQATDLAAATNVPENYLRKVLHELVRGGVLASVRGKGGGFRLAVPAEQLTILRVVSRFDRLSEQRRCILGRPECSDADPCPVHGHWKPIGEQIAAFFGGTTVADVAAKAARKRGARGRSRSRR